ncbi:MAG TPA: YbaB/EbfC family nucleoid-associated protein [Actinophytocola sp.]|nr:YbaB/EbfC family nucleoid-associated protein [Actinophytocola sp.]
MRHVAWGSMDNRTLDPDDARERLAAWKGRIDKLAADTKAMGDRFSQLEVTTRDPGGLAEVTVDSTGGLVALRLTREIERVTPDEVADTIMRTIRAAKAEIADRSEEIIEETVGTESAAGRAIADRVGQQLRARAGEPDDLAPRPQSEQSAGRGRALPPEDDEDDGDTTIWR